MTREEALMKVLKEKNKEDKIHYSKAYDIINKIYDDFENEEGDYYEGIEEGYNICKKERVCSNCRYNFCGCSIQDIILNYEDEHGLELLDFSDFGCNRFERKIGEQDNQKDN